MHFFPHKAIQVNNHWIHVIEICPWHWLDAWPWGYCKSPLACMYNILAIHYYINQGVIELWLNSCPCVTPTLTVLALTYFKLVQYTGPLQWVSDLPSTPLDKGAWGFCKSPLCKRLFWPSLVSGYSYINFDGLCYGIVCSFSVLDTSDF